MGLHARALVLRAGWCVRVYVSVCKCMGGLGVHVSLVRMRACMRKRAGHVCVRLCVPMCVLRACLVF